MKKAISVILLILPFFGVSQVPMNFTVEPCITDSTKFKLTIISDEDGKEPLEARIYNCLDSRTTITVLYQSLNEAYINKGKIEGQTIKTNISTTAFKDNFMRLSGVDFFELQKKNLLPYMAGAWMLTTGNKELEGLMIDSLTIRNEKAEQVALITTIESQTAFDITITSPFLNLPIGAVLKFRSFQDVIFMAVWQNRYFMLEKVRVDK